MVGTNERKDKSNYIWYRGFNFYSVTRGASKRKNKYMRFHIDGTRPTVFHYEIKTFLVCVRSWMEINVYGKIPVLSSTEYKLFPFQYIYGYSFKTDSVNILFEPTKRKITFHSRKKEFDLDIGQIFELYHYLIKINRII